MTAPIDMKVIGGVRYRPEEIPAGLRALIDQPAPIAQAKDGGRKPNGKKEA